MKRSGKAVTGSSGNDADVDHDGNDGEQRRRNAMEFWGFTDYGTAGSETNKAGGDCDTNMEPVDATRYRALSARGNFLAMDRVDIVYAVKDISRKMAVPAVSDWKKLER